MGGECRGGGLWFINKASELVVFDHFIVTGFLAKVLKVLKVKVLTFLKESWRNHGSVSVRNRQGMIPCVGDNSAWNNDDSGSDGYPSCIEKSRSSMQECVNIIKPRRIKLFNLVTKNKDLKILLNTFLNILISNFYLTARSLSSATYLDGRFIQLWEPGI